MASTLRAGLRLALPLLASLSASAEEPGPRPLASGLPAYRAPADPDATPALPPEPVGTLTLADALGAALARSPTLAGFSWERRAREAALLQARARPNPELRAELEDFAGSGEASGFDAAQTTLSLTQLFELGGEREQRIERAALERDLAGWDYEAARLAVAASTAERFVEVLALQRRLALADENRAVSEQAVRSVEAAVRAGAVSPVEAARARVARERAAIEGGALTHRLDAARNALAAQWGASEARFERASGDLDALTSPPALGGLLALLEQSPGLARQAAELAERRAAVALAQAERVPDVRLGLGGRHYAESGDAGLVAELSLPLPLFDRRQGALLEARYRVRRADADRAASRAALGAALLAAHRRLAETHEAALALRERALPEAERALAGAREAWRSGALRYVEVLDVQRTWLALRSEQIDALSAHQLARVEIEGLLGQPLGAAASPEDRP